MIKMHWLSISAIMNMTFDEKHPSSKYNAAQLSNQRRGP